MGTTARWLMVIAMMLLGSSARPVRAQVCIGDCDGGGRPTVDELVRGVNILLDRAALTLCPTLDTNSDGKVAVNELVRAVADILYGCGVTPPTAVPTSTRTVTPTLTSSPRPTVTPTRTQGVPNVAGTWREDQYRLASTTCIEDINDAVEELLRDLPTCPYTVTQQGASVTLIDCDEVVATGQFDENGVVNIDLPIDEDTVNGCTLVFDPEFRADLRSSPTTVQRTLDLSFAGTCDDVAPCDITVTSRWTRL